jgi:hypothetical protein
VCLRHKLRHEANANRNWRKEIDKRSKSLKAVSPSLAYGFASLVSPISSLETGQTAGRCGSGPAVHFHGMAASPWAYRGVATKRILETSAKRAAIIPMDLKGAPILPRRPADNALEHDRKLARAAEAAIERNICQGAGRVPHHLLRPVYPVNQQVVMR